MKDWIERGRWGQAWITNTVLCLLGYALLMMARHFVSETDHFTIGMSGTSGWSAWLYVAAVIVVMTQPVDRKTIWIVLGFAVAQRAMTLFGEPYLSTDIYRYVWDGVVQHAGVNPYRYVPGNAALTYLREPNSDVFANINRRDYAPTIYPPVAQMVFWLATFFEPTVQGMKAAMFVFEYVTTAALIALLRAMRRPVAEVLLYAWCPLLVWEIAGAGHVDAAVYCFAVLALLYRWREQPVMTGLFLGLAVMTKFYPLVLFPALWKRGDWKMPATLSAVVVAGYALYSSVGMKVFGFLGEYTHEEGMKDGTRYFALDALRKVPGMSGAPQGVFLVFCAVVLGGISWWCWKHCSGEPRAKALLGGAGDGGLKAASTPASPVGTPASLLGFATGPGAGRAPAFLRGAMMLAPAMMLLFAPHYPWYIAWLIPLFCVAPSLPVMVYVCGFFYLFTTILADGTADRMYLLNEILYGATAVGLVLQVAGSRLGWWTWVDCRESSTL